MLFEFIRTVVLLGISILRQTIYVKKLPNNSALANYDGISSGLRKKIGDYTTFVMPLIGALLKSMHGRGICNQERQRLALLAMLTPVIDDLTDENHILHARLMDLVNQETSFIPKNSTEALGLNIIQQLSVLTQNHSLPLAQTKVQVVNWQYESLKQKNGNLSQNELKEITFHKGGYSFLLIRYMLNEPCTESEVNTIKQLGFVIQLMDDILDCWEDSNEGIQSLPTTIRNFDKTKKILDAELMRTFHLLQALLPVQKQRKQVESMLCMVAAPVYIGLKQFLRYENEYPPTIAYKDWQRKHLIIDMEKPQNILQLFHAFSYAKSLTK